MTVGVVGVIAVPAARAGAQADRGQAAVQGLLSVQVVGPPGVAADLGRRGSGSTDTLRINTPPQMSRCSWCSVQAAVAAGNATAGRDVGHGLQG